jgi:hypothetical protein
MEFTDIASAWTQGPAHVGRLVDDHLMAAVLEADRALGRTVARRERLEFVTAVGMAAVFLWIGWSATVAWPWVSAAVLTLGVGSLFVWEQVRRNRSAAHPPRSVVARLTEALRETDHQIAQLRSVVWWYLLPLAGVAVLVLVGTMLGARDALPPQAWARVRIGAFAVLIPVLASTFGAIWWLNAHVIRSRLVPHRKAILELVDQLTDREAE